MKWLQLIVSILIAQSAGLIGSFFTVTSVNSWYSTIIKPAWNPPSWVFGPVWITLYTLMGIAAFIVWQNRNNSFAKTALIIFVIHLVLNSLWSIIFFGMQNPQFAFYEIIVLLIFIVLTTYYFFKVNTWAGVFLVPYLCWVLFASYLNYTIWQLN